MIACAKMNGNGNDFIVLDNLKRLWTTEDLSRWARRLCARRESLGADGLLVVEPSSRLHFRMRLFNRDGSEGEMCGNGARCVARYACEKGIAPKTMAFETLGGDQQARVEGTSVRLALAVVDLSQIVLERELDVSGMALRYSFLTVGVPHAVIFPEDPSLLERQDTLTTLGMAIRNRIDLFPLGTNVNFVRSDGKSLDVVTYERGVEEITLSCGTGSTASAIVGRLLGRCGDETEVRNPGGINRVSLVFEDKDKVRPFLTGRAALVAWAKLPEEALA